MLKTFSVRVVDLKKMADGGSFLDVTQQVTVQSNNKNNARREVTKTFKHPDFAVGLATEKHVR